MVEIKLSLPKELERQVKELPREELEKSLVEFLRFKLFELEIKRSEELQKGILKLLARKSKLSRKSALELGRKVSGGLLEELKEKGL